MKIRISPAASALRIAICTLVVLYLIPSTVLLNMFSRVELDNLSRAMISTAYVLDDRSSVPFSLPAGTRVVKVVTNAIVGEEVYRDPEKDEQYSTRYQVTDAAGNVLLDKVYWQKSREKTYLDTNTGKKIASKFFVGESGMPLATRSFHINLRAWPEEPLRLELQFGLPGGATTEVLARVYVADNPPPYKLRYLWQRMSREKRRRIAKGNLYPSDMITEGERRNLVRNRWTALAPIGIAGDHYRVRKLYSMKGEDLEEQPRDTIFPVGVYMSTEVVGVLPLPEEGGEVRLEFQDVEEGRERDPSALIHFSHYGTRGESLESTAATLGVAGAVIHKQVAGGVLEVHAPRELVMRAFLESHLLEPEITPIPVYVPAYVLGPGQPLDFSVTRFWDRYTPYRVDVRQVFPEEDPRFQVEPALLHYQCLDENGTVLAHGFMIHEKAISRYDVLVGSFAGFRITEPSRHYVAVPEGCRTLRLLALREDLVVSASTRPASLVRRVRVPEDSYAFNRRYEEELNGSQEETRTWFLVRPVQSAEWARTGREAFVKIQSRPPATRGHVQNEELEHRVLHPQNSPPAWQIITPTESADLEVIVGTRHRYIEMLNGHMVTREFYGEPGDDLVAPRLICLKNDHSLASLRVFLDGVLHFQGTLASQAAEIEIPAFPAGLHRISVVSSQDTSMFMSGISESRDQMHLKRTVYHLHADSLDYVIHKATQEREILSVRIYMSALAEERAVIRVRTNIPSSRRSVISSDWTFSENRFEVRPHDGELTRILASDAQLLRTGHRFSIVLGSDLDPGDYEVSLRLESGPDCFVHMAKLVPKGGTKRRVFLERGHFPKAGSE